MNNVIIEFYDGPYDGLIVKVDKGSREVKYKGEVYSRIDYLNRRGFSVFIYKKSLDVMAEV